MAETTLVIIRHAQTVDRDAARLAGWTDVDLDEVGRAQVRALAERLGAEAPPDAVYASDLTRAAETARRVADRVGRRVVPLPALREIHCGLADGATVDEVQAQMPEVWRANLTESDDDFRWPEGESYRELRERSLRALRDIAARHPGGRVAVVTHTGVITQILGWLHGEPAARWSVWRPGHASITTLRWNGAGGVLLRFDDRAHLGALRPGDGGSAGRGASSRRPPAG